MADKKIELGMRVTIMRCGTSDEKPYGVWAHLEMGDPTNMGESFMLGSFKTFDAAVAALVDVKGITFHDGIHTHGFIVSDSTLSDPIGFQTC